MRTYFYKEGNQLGHAGTYADFEGTRAKACYEFTTVLLCIVFGKKVYDFSQVDGMNIYCDSISAKQYNATFNFWANQAENEYSKFGTTSDIFSQFDRENISGYVDTEIPIRLLMKRVDDSTKALIRYGKPFFGEAKLNDKKPLVNDLLGNILAEIGK